MGSLVHSSKFILKLSIVALAVILFGLAAVVQAASIALSPASGNYGAGQTFTVNVRALPNGSNINAVESSLSFNPANLTVVSVTKGPAFSLWTTEPTFSNSAGTITFGGGSPTPFTSPSNILAITFRTTGEGTGAVTFGDTSILAADGRGTDVFQSAQNGSYVVSAATTPTPPPPTTPTAPSTPSNTNTEEAIIFGDPPQPPEIGSQVFLDQNVWYNETTGLFTWTLPFDVDAVAIEISDNPDNRPEDNEDVILEPAPEEFAITADMLQDGVQYVSINFRNQVGWGTPTNRRLQIDTTPPEPFAVNVRAANSPTDFPLLNFEAVDLTSGIDFYEMTVADKEPVRISPDEARLGYLLSELEDGTYTVRVVAHDMAGNIRESSTAVLITAGWIRPLEVEEERTIWDYLTALNLFIFFLIVVIILLVVYIWYLNKATHLREEKLRRETKEIQDQMEKIFSALRDEIYDQILHITKRKRLSTKEKEAIEGLTQALEVSETLIEKEINDVKSILR